MLCLAAVAICAVSARCFVWWSLWQARRLAGQLDSRHTCMLVLRTAYDYSSCTVASGRNRAVASSLPHEQARHAMAAVQTGVAWNVPRHCTEEPGEAERTCCRSCALIDESMSVQCHCPADCKSLGVLCAH
jgi:hypothetical protein